jgi:hypothetical protein
MRDMYTSLNVAGQEIKDKFFASLLLSSLPQSQYGILSGVIARDPNLSSEEVSAELIAEWERIGSPGKDDKPGEESASDEHGLIAKTHKAKNASSKTQRPPRKFHCTEHPSANSHDTKDCNVLKKKAKDRKEKKAKSDDDDDDDAAAIAELEIDLEGVGFGEEDYEDIFGMVADDADAKVLAMGLVSNVQDDTTYVVDSGATKHIVCTDQHLVNLVPIARHPIRVGGNKVVYATHRGTLIMGDFKLDDVLYAPEMGFNLLSVHKFSEVGYKTHFEGGICRIFDKDDVQILRIQGRGLYKIKASNTSASLIAHDHSADQLLYLHRSLGHLNWIDLVRLARSGRLGDEWRDIVQARDLNLLCESCVEGKGTRLPAPPSDKRSKQANARTHFDLWGPAKVKSVGGSLYMMSCYDDFTHRIQLYFLKKKSDAPAAFKKYLALVRNQCSTRIKIVRTDNGGEFTSKAFLELLENEGIVATPIPPKAHQLNGRIERVHLTVMNLVRTMLIDSGLPKSFWSEAASYAAFIRNRIPKRGTLDIPQELWSGEKCSLTQLRPFGSTVFVRDHEDPDQAVTALVQGDPDGVPVLQRTHAQILRPRDKEIQLLTRLQVCPSNAGIAAAHPLVEHSQGRVP